jgi:hypothetical protein
MKAKRTIEIFSAGCPVCEDTIQLINQLACPSCKVTVLDMQNPDAINPPGSAMAAAAAALARKLLLRTPRPFTV